MSRHNYTQYSNKKAETAEPTSEIIMPNDPNMFTIIPNENTDEPVVVLMEETVETAPLPETIEGVVVNCGKLNVRAKPDSNAEIVCVLNAKSEIEIDVAKSSNEWFHVCTATGVEGYCMRQYIDARL